MRYIIAFICCMFFNIKSAELTGKDLILFRATLQAETLEHDAEMPHYPTETKPLENPDEDVKKACSKTKIAILTGVTSLIGTGVTVATILLTQYANNHTPGAPN